MSRRKKKGRPRRREAPQAPPLRSDLIPQWCPDSKLIWWMRLGEWSRRLRLKRLGRAAARRVEGLVGGQPFALMWVAQVLGELGDVEGGVQAACAAEGWPEGDARGYEVIGLSLREMGRAKEANEVLSEAVARGSRDLQVWLIHLGESLRELTRAEVLVGGPKEPTERELELLELAQEAARRAPGEATAQLMLGEYLTYVGRYTEACEAYERAIAIEPDSVELKLFLEHSQKRARLTEALRASATAAAAGRRG